MDRGWRRSGSLLYLPDVSRSCCPHYTIRLPASEYTPTRDQRQTLSRWNRFVLGEEYAKELNRKYPKTKAEKRRQETTFDLSTVVHEAEAAHVRKDIPAEHVFEVTLEADDFSEEKYALFADYQRHVHHEGDDEISRPGFKRFLCSSPIRRTTAEGKQLGSYHQCYRLDGRLIAMGVLDLLPHAVSGVYFIYHRDFEKWSFGKLSAVREASLALEQGYGYYYMGYYIHSCRKMRYKGDYRPQHVLDLHSMQWNPLDDQMRALMDRYRYASMSQERARQKVEPQGAAAVNEESMASDSPAEEDIDMPDHQSRLVDEDAVPLANPLDAMNAVLAGTSLLELNVPGMLTAAQLSTLVDLDRIKIWLGEAIPVFETQDTNGWESEGGLRSIVAELAAAVGPLVAREMHLHFNMGS